MPPKKRNISEAKLDDGLERHLSEEEEGGVDEEEEGGEDEDGGHHFNPVQGRHLRLPILPRRPMQHLSVTAKKKAVQMGDYVVSNKGERFGKYGVIIRPVAGDEACVLYHGEREECLVPVQDISYAEVEVIEKSTCAWQDMKLERYEQRERILSDRPLRRMLTILEEQHDTLKGQSNSISAMEKRIVSLEDCIRTELNH